MTRINLDMAVLRTLVTAQQLGGFNRAASQIGRSQSAISQQIRKLEEQVGEPLFRKQGRDLALTDAGEIVLAYARRILNLNDEAVAAVRGRAIEGSYVLACPPISPKLGCQAHSGASSALILRSGSKRSSIGIGGCWNAWTKLNWIWSWRSGSTRATTQSSGALAARLDRPLLHAADLDARRADPACDV